MVDADTLNAALDAWCLDAVDDLIEFRRDLHAHPELSRNEIRTTAAVARRLASAGYRIAPLSVGTGIVADLDDGVPFTQRIAVRADLDALAMDDLKDVPYRSTVEGVAHACGHDVHTTVAVGAALFVAKHPHLRAQNVRFIFQPAEELVPGGSLDVIADGALDDVDTVIGLHCEPKLPVGTLALRDGPITSAADMVTIRLFGPGGHTARPELTVDLIRVAAQVIDRVPGLVSAATPDADVKVVFGHMHSGDAANVIPGAAELRASVRTPSVEAWELLEHRVTEAVAQVIGDTHASYEVDYVRGVPPTVNDPAVVSLLRTAAVHAVGDDRVVEATQSWGGDDFAWLTRHTPGAYVRLGVADPDHRGPSLDLHAGHFDVDERAIGIGVRLLAHALAASGRVIPTE